MHVQKPALTYITNLFFIFSMKNSKHLFNFHPYNSSHRKVKTGKNIVLYYVCNASSSISTTIHFPIFCFNKYLCEIPIHCRRYHITQLLYILLLMVVLILIYFIIRIKTHFIFFFLSFLTLRL